MTHIAPSNVKIPTMYLLVNLSRVVRLILFSLAFIISLVCIPMVHTGAHEAEQATKDPLKQGHKKRILQQNYHPYRS